LVTAPNGIPDVPLTVDAPPIEVLVPVLTVLSPSLPSRLSPGSVVWLQATSRQSVPRNAPAQT
jgi:hypothetical protein